MHACNAACFCGSNAEKAAANASPGIVLCICTKVFFIAIAVS